ncbi:MULTISPECIES: DUF1657 domain-containing protein [unclassified Domibacillus]|uniref:DUF1657 domain-containing protein n=1 Tax=unclassified Domibacillus TaxID=2632383 RepID=UPI001F5A0CF7|nr:MULTISPECIES: DUF1657 domain-containing protein [unclassified Domibacillus]MCI2252970.1 DUF1657 domain-containing protein [Domibacillus sp. PGB-M46]
MKVTSEMDQCLASLRSIQSSLSTLIVLSKREESKEELYEAILAVREAADDVQKRLETY